MKQPKIPICPYCGALSEKVNGSTIYPHRKDLSRKTFYRCQPCKAFVGCHDGTEHPLGRLANAELREAKKQAHAAFDPIWKRGYMKRKDAYFWLSRQLGLKYSETHIGMFDVETCQKTVQLSEELVFGVEFEFGEIATQRHQHQDKTSKT